MRDFASDFLAAVFFAGAFFATAFFATAFFAGAFFTAFLVAKVLPLGIKFVAHAMFTLGVAR